MIKDQCISITDLRRNAKKVLDRLPKDGVQYIFVNNRPKAVLVDIDDFEEYFERPVLRELPEEEITPSMRKRIEKTKSKPKSQFLNL